MGAPLSSTPQYPIHVHEGVPRSAQRPPYQEGFEYVAEVFQCEHAVTHGDDPKPVLATSRIGPCVSLVGWSPKYTVGFLAHYSGLTDVSGSYKKLLNEVFTQLDGESTGFNVRIVGGYDRVSEDMMYFFKRKCSVESDIEMKLIEEDTGGRNGYRSIALDTRSGEVFSYDSQLNPYRREAPKVRCVGGKHASLAYAPEKSKHGLG